MGSEWQDVRIEEIQAEQKGAIAIGPFGSRMKSDCYVSNGVPVIRGTNIDYGPSFKGEFVFISNDKADSLGSCNVYKNDLVFPHRGSIGEVGIVSDETRYVISSSLMKLTVDSSKVNPKYLYYFFKSRLGRHELLKNASQVGTPGIGQPISSLKNIEFRLPPLRIQNRIEEVITAIDKKIRLNRQTNQTLELMAQALFKSWFVDFDPVIDNALAAGNPIPDALVPRAELRKQQLAKPDHNPLAKEILDLFPSEFEETDEMGWVPKGWEVKSLDDIAHYQNGLALQKFRPEDDAKFLPVLKIAHLKQGFTDGKEKASPAIKPSCIVNDGDIVFSWSGSLMVDVWCGGSAALNQHLFKVTSDVYPRWFYYLLTSHHLLEFQRIAADKAVTMGHIKREHLSQAKCAVPSEALLQTGDEQVESIIKKQILLRLESNQLTKLRDTLLPKLISGELRLPESMTEAEQLVTDQQTTEAQA